MKIEDERRCFERATANVQSVVWGMQWSCACSFLHAPQCAVVRKGQQVRLWPDKYIRSDWDVCQTWENLLGRRWVGSDCWKYLSASVRCHQTFFVVWMGKKYFSLFRILGPLCWLLTNLMLLLLCTCPRSSFCFLRRDRTSSNGFRVANNKKRWSKQIDNIFRDKLRNKPRTKRTRFIFFFTFGQVVESHETDWACTTTCISYKAKLQPWIRHSNTNSRSSNSMPSLRCQPSAQCKERNQDALFLLVSRVYGPPGNRLFSHFAEDSASVFRYNKSWFGLVPKRMFEQTGQTHSEDDVKDSIDGIPWMAKHTFCGLIWNGQTDFIDTGSVWRRSNLPPPPPPRGPQRCRRCPGAQWITGGAAAPEKSHRKHSAWTRTVRDRIPQHAGNPVSAVMSFSGVLFARRKRWVVNNWTCSILHADITCCISRSSNCEQNLIISQPYFHSVDHATLQQLCIFALPSYHGVSTLYHFRPWWTAKIAGPVPGRRCGQL